MQSDKLIGAQAFLEPTEYFGNNQCFAIGEIKLAIIADRFYPYNGTCIDHFNTFTGWQY